MITFIVTYLILLGEVFISVFGLTTYLLRIPEAITQLQGMLVGLNNIFSLVFYFIPKTTCLTLLGIGAFLLVLRIGLAIINLIWW